MSWTCKNTSRSPYHLNGVFPENLKIAKTIFFKDKGNNALHRHNVQSVTYLIGQNFATKPKFRHFCPKISLNLLFVKILSDKNFAGQNFRYQAKISPLLSKNILKSIVCKDFVGQKFHRAKISPPSRNFVR